MVALGANHNFFNRIWGDEWGPPGGFARGWCGRGDAESGRLARPAQERLLTSLVTPFMEREVAGRAVSVAALGAGAAPPRRLAGAPVTSVWLPPAARRVRLLGPGATLRTPRGADLVARGFSRVAVCSFKEICGGMRRETFPRSVDALHLRWTAAGATLAIPVARADADARAARLLAFRIAVEPQPPPAIIFEGSEEPPPPPLPDDVNPQPLGTPQSLTVRVRDRAGASAAVVVPPTAAALRYPPAPGSTARDPRPRAAAARSLRRRRPAPSRRGRARVRSHPRRLRLRE